MELSERTGRMACLEKIVPRKLEASGKSWDQLPEKMGAIFSRPTPARKVGKARGLSVSRIPTLARSWWMAWAVLSEVWELEHQ
ncbi:hypothetical protein D3C86_1416610 [compost metagenome]